MADERMVCSIRGEYVYASYDAGDVDSDVEIRYNGTNTMILPLSHGAEGPEPLARDAVAAFESVIRLARAGHHGREEVVQDAVSAAEANITTQIAHQLEERAGELEAQAQAMSERAGDWMHVIEKCAAKELRSQATRIREGESNAEVS